MELVLVRHGESVWNQANSFTGWEDVELSEKGQYEAQKAGVLLKDYVYSFDIASGSSNQSSFLLNYHFIESKHYFKRMVFC